MNTIIVDGKKLTEAEFKKLQENPGIILKEIAPGEYQILERLFG